MSRGAVVAEVVIVIIDVVVNVVVVAIEIIDTKLDSRCLKYETLVYSFRKSGMEGVMPKK
jgi:hypothetical protein